MRRLRIRGFLAVSALLVGTASWVSYLAARYLETGTWRLGLDSGTARPSHYGLGVAAAVGFLLAAFLAGYGMRRWVIRPLEAIGEASRRIARGDLDVELPDGGRIREIGDAIDGFGTMVAGLRASVERQSALEEERRFFVGAIAHDLRTPLFALRGYLDGLDRGIAGTPEQRSRYVAVCREKAQQLDRLVADLFAYAKSESAELGRREETVDPGEQLRRAADGIRPAAATKGVAVEIETDEQACCVKGDAHLLERALANLFDNAVRHAPANGTIEAACRAGNGRIELAVRDDGLGFAPAELGRVFEPLYRGEASRSRDTGGAGLGLAIARRIFRLHGGDLTAANRPNGGAELMGWLPMVPRDESDGERPEKAESAGMSARF